MLCRRDLEQGRMREVYDAAVADRALSDEALAASLADTLQRRPEGAGWWVFAYGSLLWNPIFPVEEMRPVTVRGWHRRFCLWSLGSRGTPDHPGLVLGLDRGGCCKGVILRLPAAIAREELRLLWRREMVVGSYHPRWIATHDHHGHAQCALAFVVRRDHPQFTGKLPLPREIDVLATARGAFGSSADYLERTRVALVAHGIRDGYLERLAAAIARRAKGTPAMTPTAEV